MAKEFPFVIYKKEKPVWVDILSIMKTHSIILLKHLDKVVKNKNSKTIQFPRGEVSVRVPKLYISSIIPKNLIWDDFVPSSFNAASTQTWPIYSWSPHYKLVS